jgi:hypothetical protein
MMMIGSLNALYLPNHHIFLNLTSSNPSRILASDISLLLSRFIPVGTFRISVKIAIQKDKIAFFAINIFGFTFFVRMAFVIIAGILLVGFIIIRAIILLQIIIKLIVVLLSGQIFLLVVVLNKAIRLSPVGEKVIVIICIHYPEKILCHLSYLPSVK